MTLDTYNPDVGCQDILARYVTSHYLTREAGAPPPSKERVIAALLKADFLTLADTYLDIRDHEKQMEKDKIPPKGKTLLDVFVDRYKPESIGKAKDYLENMFKSVVDIGEMFSPRELRAERAAKFWENNERKLAAMLVDYVDARIEPKFWPEVQEPVNYLAKDKDLPMEHIKFCKDQIRAILEADTNMPALLTDDIADDFGALAIEKKYDYDPEVLEPGGLSLVTVKPKPNEASFYTELDEPVNVVETPPIVKKPRQKLKDFFFTSGDPKPKDIPIIDRKAEDIYAQAVAEATQEAEVVEADKTEETTPEKEMVISPNSVEFYDKMFDDDAIAQTETQIKEAEKERIIAAQKARQKAAAEARALAEEEAATKRAAEQEIVDAKDIEKMEKIVAKDFEAQDLSDFEKHKKAFQAAFSELKEMPLEGEKTLMADKIEPRKGTHADQAKASKNQWNDVKLL